MKFVNDNILNTDSRFIVHGCNAQGVMGAGVAKAIANQFPGLLDQYKTFLKALPENLKLGAVDIFVTENNQFIGNLITQENYGRTPGVKYANPGLIFKALNIYIHLVKIYGEDIKTIASPKIGCGLGGLDWETEVKPIYEKMEQEHGVEFIIYEYR